MQRFLFILAAVAAVMSLGTFAYVSGAIPFMGSNPETCANCHVMDSAYENWIHAPHGRDVKCVDCHLPHDNLVNYWFEKGKTGMHDVFYFSAGLTPELIRAKPEAQAIIQGNCIRCHKETVETIMMGPQAFERHCWDCHRSVAHGQRGIGISTYQDTVIYPVK